MKDDEKEGVNYNYTFFHVTFLLGAMYVSMLITNWASIDHDDTGSYKLNYGFIAFWVKIASSWVVALLYVWTMIAPCVFPSRDFSG